MIQNSAAHDIHNLRVSPLAAVVTRKIRIINPSSFDEQSRGRNGGLNGDPDPDTVPQCLCAHALPKFHDEFVTLRKKFPVGGILMHPPSHAPPSSSAPPPGASIPPPSVLHLLMARSVSKGELDSSVGNVGAAGLALAGQMDDETVEGRDRRPPGSEMWVSDHGVPNPVTSDPRFVYDWAEIPPGKEKVLIGDGKKMNVIGIGSLNLKLHLKTDFNLKLTRVYVTESIKYNLFSLHEAQGRQKIIMDEDGVHLFDNRVTFLRDSVVCTRLAWTRQTRPPLQDVLLCLSCLVFQAPRLVSPGILQCLVFHLLPP